MRCLMMPALLGLVVLTGCNNLISLDKVVLTPDPDITLTPADFGYVYDESSLPVAEGRSVTIWYVPSPESKGLIVVIPGSSGNKSLYARLALPVLGGKGYDILLMDYEGFGNSPGEATLQHAADDALVVMAHATMLHKNVILFGISLGSPLAARGRGDLAAAAVILESSLIVTDVLDNWLSQQSPLEKAIFQVIGPATIQSQLPPDFDVLTYIPQVRSPKLIIHSPDDSLTPLDSALKVYDAASPPKTFWQTYGDHGEMILLEPDVYSRTLLAWLDAALGS